MKVKLTIPVNNKLIENVLEFKQKVNLKDTNKQFNLSRLIHLQQNGAKENL